MSTEAIVITALAGCCVVWFVVASLLIYENLRRRGEKVSFIWLRAMLPFYVSRYRKLTRQESGKVGNLFYHWVVSINLALLLVVIAFAARWLK
jgi:hypothetical protein